MCQTPVPVSGRSCPSNSPNPRICPYGNAMATGMYSSIVVGLFLGIAHAEDCSCTGAKREWNCGPDCPGCPAADCCNGAEGCADYSTCSGSYSMGIPYHCGPYIPSPPLPVVFLPPNCSECPQHSLPDDWHEVCKKNWMTAGCASCYTGNPRAPEALQIKGCRLKGKEAEFCNNNDDCLSGVCTSEGICHGDGPSAAPSTQPRYLVEQAHSKSPHYGMPGPECGNDEINLGPSLRGGDQEIGVVCGVKCSDLGCPTDVPPGTTAYATCAFIDEGRGDRYCGLACQGDDECPAAAVCAGLPERGFCVYDRWGDGL